ncbi:hypothetical protein HD553DRAFT_278580, partial [Filobasidium floriforme]|uniref:uncharacterized protein n=1 Tax=Filobasidium floriforme TaxID=5210 RepID=UPI001E8E0303
EDGSHSYFGGDFKTWNVPNDEPGKFTSRQLFKAGSPHTGNGPQSTATPPYHYHYYQTETFHVLSGTLCYKIDGKFGRLQPGQSIRIPTYVKHTFWNDPETGKDLEVHVTVEGGDNDGFSDDFVHNFYGYLSSQTLQNATPNPFQMLRFLHSADVALADIPGCRYTAPVINFVFGKFCSRSPRHRSLES